MRPISKIKIMVLAVTILILAGMAQASEFSVETDPATFIFKGYAAHIFYRPDLCKSLKIGLGTYKLELPDFFINMDSKNANQNWTAKITGGAALFLEYDFSARRSVPFGGFQLASQNYQIESSGASSEFTNVVSMFYLGYRWFPIENQGLYLKPWVGVGYQEKSSGNNCAGSGCYDVSPHIEFATVHLGYTF